MPPETTAPAAEATTSATISTSPSTQELPTSAAPSPSNYDRPTGETTHDPDVAFEGLGLEIEELAETSTQPKPATAAVQPPQPAAQPQQTQQQAPQAQPPQQPQAQPQQQQPPAQSPEAAAQPPTLDGVLEQFEANSQQIAEQLAPNFAISPELAAELEADYNAAVPKLLSNVFVQSVQASLHYMKQFVPQMVQQMATERAAYEAAEKRFFEMFPDLNRATHGNDILAYARAFAQANPNLRGEDLFNMVGPAVMTKHGIVRGAAKAPAPPLNRPTAFVPAGNSAPGAMPIVSQAELNPFEALGRDFES